MSKQSLSNQMRAMLCSLVLLLGVVAQEPPHRPPQGGGGGLGNGGRPGQPGVEAGGEIGPPPGMQPPALLPALDTDGNGQLSPDEIRNSPQSLLGMDRNGDGALAADELLGESGQRRFGVIADGIHSISPNRGTAGSTNLTLQIELNGAARPPIPPVQIPPSSVRVGSLSASSVNRQGMTVTAVLTIPAGTAAGPQDVVVAFPGPGRGITVSAVGAGAFTVAAGTAPKREPLPDPVPSLPYPVVDTGQGRCYDNQREIKPPAPGQPFHGQDGQYQGLQPRYRDNGDGTVSDLNTGLMWQQDPGGKKTYPDAVAGAAALRLGGHDDWRLPTIKELYSLIDFTGSIQTTTPYIDTHYFVFRYPDTSDGQARIIDAQYWSSTEYVGTTMGGAATVFGVNFADGRIKGYPRDRGRSGPMQQFVRYVRGNPAYGKNDFADNGDGTVTDRATGLMWQQADSGKALNWEEALAYAEDLTCGGHTDWRLPNAKELQSIVDYTHAPDATDLALRRPAIDPVFSLTEPESWFWTGTTHLDHNASFAVYLAFGQAFGVFSDRNGGRRLVDVHGAGAQRSDPKSGDPQQWADGFGPQRDQRRVFNYVRAVRGGLTE